MQGVQKALLQKSTLKAKLLVLENYFKNLVHRKYFFLKEKQFFSTKKVDGKHFLVQRK